MDKENDNTNDQKRWDVLSPEEEAAWNELEKRLAQTSQERSRVAKTVKPKQDQAAEV